MRTVLIPLLHTLAAVVRSRAALHLEILALRQQLAVLHHSGPKRARLRPVDRFFWACLFKLWPGWRHPLIAYSDENEQPFRSIVNTDSGIVNTHSGDRERSEATLGV
jgi:hypothetical protein